jgi:thioredoxin 1
MHKLALLSSLLVVLLSSCTSAPESAAPPPAPAAAVSSVGPVADQVGLERTLLFFLKPSGRPCIRQDAILRDMGSRLTDKVDVEYVPVTDPGNRPTLREYGVRSLPALILVDADGAELHRFPPGIRDADAILAVL